MSEYTREEILKLIEENGGPEGLDLSGKDLSSIDVGTEAIKAELDARGIPESGELPVWLHLIDRESLTFKFLKALQLIKADWGINLQGVDLSTSNLQEACLQGANLQGADLSGANLRKANLDWANLQSAYLKYANCQEADLRDSNLQKANVRDADLRGARLSGANLQGAGLGDAYLQQADLPSVDAQGANLSGANLQRAYLLHANLQAANLRGADFRGANLRDADLQKADLSYSHLEKVSLFPAVSLKGACFYNSYLDDTRVKREQLGKAIGEELGGKYGDAKEAYLALKENFAQIGRYNDAAWAYQKERQMEKMSSAPWRARRFHGENQLGDVWEWDHEDRIRKWESGLPTRHPRVLWFYTRHTAKWLTDWFVELLCGYGESLWRVLAWMLLVILGFAAYYQVTHAVVTSSQDAATSLWDHLIFSLGAFTTLQPARLKAARPGVELLTTIQAIIGISLAGLLGFVAGNRIRRS
jgi:uncharacterized protein YjbI with pentapeptide repeats